MDTHQILCTWTGLFIVGEGRILAFAGKKKNDALFSDGKCIAKGSVRVYLGLLCDF